MAELSSSRWVPVQGGDAGFNRDYLHLSLEGTQLGYWQLDLRTWQLTASPQCKAKYGRDPSEEFTLEMFLDCVHPEDRDRVLQALTAVSRSNPNCSVEYRSYWADQQLHWNLSVGIALADEEGEPQQLVGVTLDISERKRLEAALAQQERHYRQILETIPDMLFRLDRQGRCLEFKPPSCSSSPHPPDCCVGKLLSDLFPAPWAEAICQHLQLAFETQQVQEMEYLEAESSPHPRYWQARFVPFAEGEMLVIVRDITSHKQVQLKLQQQIERERLLNQLARAINAAVDLPTLFQVTLCSARQVLRAARVSLYQYRPAEGVWVGVASDGDFETLPSTGNWRVPDSKDSVVMDHLKRLQVFCVQDPEEVADTSPLTEGVLPEKQDHQLGPWLVVPVAHQGRLWGGLSLRRWMTDPGWESEDIELATAISDHLAVAIQQAELYQQLQHTNAELDYQVRVRNAELREAYDYEALLQLITEEIRASLDEQQILETVAQELAQSLNLSNCAIALYDPERQVSVVVVEYSEGEGIRRIPVEIPFGDFADLFHQLQRGQVCHFSHFHHPCWPTHDCSTLLMVPIWDSRDPDQLDRTPQVLGHICGARPPGQVFTEREQRLITRVASQCAIAIRQARFHQTIQQQVQQLQALNQLKDEFLHMVSHEMRTPLTNMKLAIGFLSKANLTEQEKRYLQILEMETNREIDLINELLELQAIESGKKDLKVSSISPQAWIHEISAPFMLRAAEQRQQFHVQLDPGLLPLDTDESLLSRVVSELLNNACKYTPPEQEIALQVSQAFQKGTPGWLITVRNTGVEIPAEALPHLFEKFYRVTHLDQRKVGGTGLGLPLAQKAVELLQGSLTVESHSQQVIFRLWCPHQGSL